MRKINAHWCILEIDFTDTWSSCRPEQIKTRVQTAQTRPLSQWNSYPWRDRPKEAHKSLKTPLIFRSILSASHVTAAALYMSNSKAAKAHSTKHVRQSINSAFPQMAVPIQSALLFIPVRRIEILLRIGLAQWDKPYLFEWPEYLWWHPSWLASHAVARRHRA